MRNTGKWALGAVLFFMLGASGAADLPALQSLFRREFDRFYVPAACGANIERLVLAAASEGIDLSGAEVVHLTGAGFWELRPLSARGGRSSRLDDSGMWYFHWFLVAEGKVIDFDFTGRPTVVEFPEYLQRQFVPREDPARIWGNPYDIESLMNAWELNVYPADLYAQVRGDTQRAGGRAVKFKDYVNLPALFAKVKADRKAGITW